MTFKRLRIVVLLLVLAIAGGTTYYQRMAVARWDRPLSIEIYPINGDGSPAVAQYIASLRSTAFADIPAFINREAARYGITVAPLTLVGLNPEIKAHPPTPPANGQTLKVVLWSLQLRWYVFRHARSFAPTTARLFVLYHTPREQVALPHSLGLRKGMVGVVHAFADETQEAGNNIVIAHEVLHTLGASDKYGHNNQPQFPDGYGEPQREPLYPQTVAEIMAGRLAIGPEEARAADSLEVCTVGTLTAREIGWVK